MKLRTAIILITLFALTACAPEFDWHELNSIEGGFSALMPGKPRYEERNLASSRSVTIHLWSAYAANSVFAVGYADYPVADARLLDATRNSLVANMRGRLLEQRRAESHGLLGLEFTAESSDRALRAKLLLSGSRLFQIVILGPKNDLGNAAGSIELFLSSFRPLATRPKIH